MIAKRVTMLLTMGAFILGLSALGSQKNPVTRPIKQVMHQTMVITLNANGIPVGWEVSGIGNCSHWGLSENRGAGFFDASGKLYATGITTAANRDQIFWSSAGDPSTAVITGGTGRFAGATGGVTAVSLQMVLRPDSPPGTLVYDIVLCNEGTIAY